MKPGRFLFAGALALCLGAGAQAARADARWLAPEVETHPLGPGGSCMVIHSDPPARSADTFSKLLYMNRCVGGCEVRDPGNWTTSSIDDLSGICDPVRLDTCTLSEFGQDDETWEELVACAKEVLRPYGVQVVVEDPGNVPHHEVMVAGTAAELGIASADTLGIANFSCVGWDGALSFAFANHEALQGDPTYLCHVAVHEPGHSFGLSHVYACEDPMTYLTKCGTKYFRDRELSCAEAVDDAWVERDMCWCENDAQNAHQHLLELFGPGIGARPPEVTIPFPQAGDAIATGAVVYALAHDERGIARVELYLNTWKWYELGGHDYRDRDDPYVLRTPNDLPDGVVDIEVRAYNDLGLMTSSGIVSVHKGAPCVSAESCLPGQICNQGRCFWLPPTVEAGGACERAQDCIEGGCRARHGETRCAPSCEPDAEQPCADGFDCVTAETVSFCWPQGSGCCSAAGRRQRVPWPQVGLALGVLFWVSRRRSRR